MIKKFHILLIILTLGFLTTPTLTYACGTKTTQTQKSCCKKSKTEKNNKNDCCKKRNSNSDKENNGCDGKCNKSNCSCPTTNFAFILPFCTEDKVKIYFAKTKKNKNYYNENHLSDGFTSIWTPPKIA